MTQPLSDQLICHKDSMVQYSPPDHGGTVNARLADRSFCPKLEMGLGEIEPGGVTHKHLRETEHQVMYATQGVAAATLENEDQVSCGLGTICCAQNYSHTLNRIIDHKMA